MDSDQQDDIPFYEKPEWADVVPIPQDDGPNPLVPIAYTKEYSTTMDYFRAISRSQEKSQRALDLTKIVIEQSPSHYTVWHYRQRLLEALSVDLSKELDWTQWMIGENPKSYQIWHHRQVVIGRLSAGGATSTSTISYRDLSETQQKTKRETVQVELDFIASALADDAKNYHAWSYRQWVLSYFGKGPWWDEELAYIDNLLTTDIRNNSAWNQRFYVVTLGPQGLTDEIVQREVQYTKTKIERTPNNESPWVYLSGILNKAKHPLSEVKEFCEGLLEVPRANFSSFLHSTLLDIYEQEAKVQKSAEIVNKAKGEAVMLAEKVDTIRSKYWNWRKDQLKDIVVDA
ncbi:CAAX geranylgeranyltransferase alpha subunit [Modicella reniformis]|uniref:Protein farnesyltransferase/geranylgeranyltransferase type-1 subunit alpha n=1 Tax=Modicella reniformis TaxID=1440133 RepID=A0A9P6MH86_9FUNG|nr:CAAX geranylgeranyltransferase alpha subunit [Modicella reniformis]